MLVYLVNSGDDIECGEGLHSIFASQEGAIRAAEVLVKESDDRWRKFDDFADWEFVRVPGNEVGVYLRYWKGRHTHDIITVRTEEVL